MSLFDIVRHAGIKHDSQLINSITHSELRNAQSIARLSYLRVATYIMHYYYALLYIYTYIYIYNIYYYN